MFKKVLVANRGEIAVQIIRALHDMNITAVAVYSSVDKDSLFVRLADEAICIGGPQPSESYLNMAQIISAANLTGCEAIHPGYGFLSENAEFAELCETCHIKFIGPSHELISLMGDKSNAREAMKRAGVPVIPGSDGVVSTVAQAKRVAEDIGFPVLLKSAAGGGGKGIREVDDPDALQAAFEQTQQEARLSYDDEDIYVEKLIRHAKHVEMQVIADTFGNVVYLPERDCSLQRNHQKVIEESPCLLISPEERKQLGEIVANATLKLGYTNTGTYEFLMDDAHHFYFMEMNTRLQVEHTITEEVTGIELVKAQLAVAAGEKLAFSQADAAVKGHALECRLNAEDPANNFAPQPGQISQLLFPAGSLGVRIDSGVTAGSFISPFYDSMIAKLIVHLNDRDAVIAKMKRVLGELEIEGIQTNQDFLKALIGTDQFKQGTYSTSFIENDVLSDKEGFHVTESV
ncbi:Biotin carboxylase [Lentilactobacillus parabuchneri]|jgi:acetyl-CoA carboxylase biotin carboxylase subunit|uniref:biotin carboxylase n=2 Tax=Lentilactobacillus parabuchneri TaxID=152331 RepID=A0A1X1FDM5_9LACO|nr:acetyl-CoA carboxylase biotin carboxylase subunit [Lentilactobacillus parabuchneri]APR07930.1 Biotin carboxylase [Lentilactobacillus parabuchneri]KRM47171.1 pyruvate carboxylase [Lentilactobacillus parabuchneri DSM 5707 = NBRC 107865]KRN70932.1 pyruvate carboxylase [Lentilactobacillus parabuchneri]MBW0222098.1 acetyl-CoA carboxylase biotin carboxylase subunit [Lentilactobacillus parabuchneri]MBW0245665.1 acetyl-CoA carboxylase biotin carboxylase subunit [Lentilactobacillus parabuchneri]